MPDLNDITAALRKLARTRVYIGIPGEGEPRADDTFGNVSRGYVFEFGSPATNMPARPHLVPGVEAALPEITARLEAAARVALDGGDPKPALMAAGQAGVNSVTGMIDARLEPPIRPVSYLSRTTGRLARGYRRQRAERGETGPLIFHQREIPSDVMRQAEGEAAAATPLVDTGAYRRSFTFVIREG